MPGVPSNKACERCKQRHLKCDETRPGCQRCATAGIECPGYTQARKFIDEGATVRRRYAPYQRSGPRSNPPNAPGTNLSGPNPDSNQQSAETGLNSLAAESLVASGGSDLSGLSKDGLEITPKKLHPNGSGNPSTFQQMAYPTGLASNISPNENRQQEADSLANSISNNMPVAGYSGTDVDPASALYNNPFDIPLDLNFAAMLDQAPYATSLPSNGALDPKNGPRDVTDLYSELMMNSERELGFLVRHYAEFIAPWLDLYNSGRYYGQYVSLKTTSTPFIKYAAAAVASKHLARLKGVKPLVNPLFTNPATTEVYPNTARVDWHFKASNYYHQSLAGLRQAVSKSLASQNIDSAGSPIQIMCQDLNLDTGRPGEMRSPNVASPASVSGSVEEILTATVILTVYDLLSIAGPEWESRLLGIKPLLESLAPLPRLQSGSIFSPATRAAVWNFATFDYLASYVNRQRTRLEPDHLDLWRAAGIPIDDYGKLRLDNVASFVHAAGETSLARDDVICHALTWLLLKLMNFIAEFKEMQQTNYHHSTSTSTPTPTPAQTPDTPATGQPRSGTSTPLSSALTAKWLRLSYEFQTWFDSLPETFQPYIRIEHPQDFTSTSQPDNDTAAAPPPPPPSSISPFPEILYSTSTHAAAMQHYHFARIILLLNRPHDAQGTPRDRLLGYREVTKEVDNSCREIAGVALGRPSPAVRIYMVQPLFVVGQCFDSPQGRQILVDLLRGVESDCGWLTEYRVRQLKALWDRA